MLFDFAIHKIHTTLIILFISIDLLLIVHNVSVKNTFESLFMVHFLVGHGIIIRIEGKRLEDHNQIGARA